MTNRGLRIDLPLVNVEKELWAAVLDCRGTNSCRYAIYLRKVRAGVYSRIRCHELLQISDSDDLPPPTTIYIGSNVSQIQGRDRPKLREKYCFRVCKVSNRSNVTWLARHYSPDGMAHWSPDREYSTIDIDPDGAYSGLEFVTEESDASFAMVLGIHVSRP
jgi:hypothetical protein